MITTNQKLAYHMQPENRRSFVKKSLATSMSISFIGLLRAHGEEGAGTTTTNTSFEPNQATVPPETVIWEETVTFNPDESTAPAETIPADLGVSIQKKEPFYAFPILSPCIKVTVIQSPPGLIQILAGNVQVFIINPIWRVRITEKVEAGLSTSYVLEDCASYAVDVGILLELVDPLLPFPAQLVPYLTAIANAATSILDPGNIGNPFLGQLNQFVAATGPSLFTGISLSAGYGFDVGNPGQIGPIVNAGGQYGNLESSSHGYFLSAKSDITPTSPSNPISIEWGVRLKRSKFFNIHAHIEAAIRNAFNAGLIQAVQAKFPNQIVHVDCVIPWLPESAHDASFAQSVFAYDISPTSLGDSCPIAYPDVLSNLSDLNNDIDDEDPPSDNQWEKVDPSLPACPPPPLTA